MQEYAIEKERIEGYDDNYNFDKDPSGVKALVKKEHGMPFYQWVIDNDKIDRLYAEDYGIITTYVNTVLDKDSGVTINAPRNYGSAWIVTDDEVPIVTKRREDLLVQMQGFKEHPSFQYTHDNFIIPESTISKDRRTISQVKQRYVLDPSNPKNIPKNVPISFKDLRIPKKKVREEEEEEETGMLKD
jgi:hypothetical protein